MDVEISYASIPEILEILFFIIIFSLKFLPIALRSEYSYETQNKTNK